MSFEQRLYDQIRADSYLEHAFLRWILTPAVQPAIVQYIYPQYVVVAGEHTYRIDYAIIGAERHIAVELDGFAFHGDRDAFTYDRMVSSP